MPHLIASDTAEQLICFTVQLDEAGNELSLRLKENKYLIFSSENQTFQELKCILLSLEAGHIAEIHYTKTEDIAFNGFDTLVSYLCEHKLACQLSFHCDNPLSSKDHEYANQILENLYQHALRKKYIDPQRVKNLHDLFSATPVKGDKVRRAKQLLNKGVRINTQTQHQRHHHKELGIQEAQEQQRQEQVEIQQYQTRQNQIQQQQQRMLNLNKELSEVNVGALGRLINESDLALLVTDTLNLEEVTAIWYALVGKYASSVEDAENRITHVPEATMRLIIKHKEHFSYGILFDDLPNGFGFTVQDFTYEHWGQTYTEQRSILYFDKHLEKTVEIERLDSFLAPSIEEIKTAFSSFGSVGQFYPFFDSAETINKAEYQEFNARHQADFDAVFYPETTTEIKARRSALIHLMLLDTPELASEKASIEAFLEDFSDANIDGIRSILIDQGAAGILQLINK